ncbi:hypothetical protein [uncultured Wocania sp.]|uniref:hypothetical protein n=1 Tax=uncultured Wocania sp. TaxID=2834404 RepID=UPI0030FA4574
MEKNKIEVPLLKTPKEISDLLIEISGVDIFKKSRVRNIVEHRAFFCYLLNEKFELGPSAISAFIRTQPKLKTYDHATVIHALKKFKIYKTYREEYFNILEGYFEISPDADYKELPKLERLLNQYKEIKLKYNNASKKIKRYEEKLNDFNELKRKIKSGFTKNEILYRDLNEAQMKIYDERAALILKSFNWQKPKNEYEIINCEA